MQVEKDRQTFPDGGIESIPPMVLQARERADEIEQRAGGSIGSAGLLERTDVRAGASISAFWLASLLGHAAGFEENPAAYTGIVVGGATYAFLTWLRDIKHGDESEKAIEVFGDQYSGPEEERAMGLLEKAVKTDTHKGLCPELYLRSADALSGCNLGVEELTARILAARSYESRALQHTAPEEIVTDFEKAVEIYQGLGMMDAQRGALEALGGTFNEHPQEIILTMAGRSSRAGRALEESFERQREEIQRAPVSGDGRRIGALTRLTRARLDTDLPTNEAIIKHYTEAEAHYAHALRIGQGSAGTWHARGTNLIRLFEKTGSEGHLNGAMACFETTAALEPERPGTNFSLGQCHELLGDESKAAGFYENELRINPDNDAAKAALESLRRPGVAQ